MVIASGVIRKKMIVNAFLNAGAISEKTAKTLKEVGVYKGLGIKFAQLESSGILRHCEGNKYYVDESKL